MSERMPKVLRTTRPATFARTTYPRLSENSRHGSSAMTPSIADVTD